MPEVEEVYSAKQAAAQLGLSPAMTRRYGAALEEVTGEPIRQLPRDGRQYRSDQLAVMLQAKAYVEANPRLTVTEALKVALGLSSEPVASELSTASQISSQTLSVAFSQALEQTLMPELRELRAEVASLREQVAKPPSQERVGVSPEIPGRDSIEERVAQADDETFYGYRIRDKDHRPEPNDGVLVRIARRVERLLGRG